MEWIRNASAGWSHFNENGKFAVLLLGALLYLCYSTKRKTGRKEQLLLWYTVLTTVLVICPVTAAILMRYQTRFYDYEWLWSMVPVTLMVAYACTEIYSRFYEKWGGKSRWKLAIAAVFGLAVLILCGNLGSLEEGRTDHTINMEKATLVLDDLTQDGKNKDIYLWAPREILEYARSLDGNIKLIYGRNMWDTALQAYSYDTYEPEIVKLYEWMEGLKEEQGAEVGDPEKKSPEMEQIAAARTSVQTACGYGVNTVVIPDTTSDSVIAVIREMFRTEGNQTPEEPRHLEGYLIFRAK